MRELKNSYIFNVEYTMLTSFSRRLGTSEIKGLMLRTSRPVKMPK